MVARERGVTANWANWAWVVFFFFGGGGDKNVLKLHGGDGCTTL